MIRLFALPVLLLIHTSLSANPGTMSTDDNPAVKAEASLSGYRTTPLELPEKQQEVEGQEEKSGAFNEDKEDKKVKRPRESQGENE